MAGKKYSDLFATSNTANVADTDLFAIERTNGNTYILRANSIYNYVNTRIANATILTVGNTTVNTQINSSSIKVESILANNSLGSPGQFLASNGTTGGLYWATPASGSFSNGISYIWPLIQTFQSNVSLVGNSTNLIVIGSSTINSTTYSGTSNNSNFLEGSSLSTLQGQITGNAATAYTNAITIAANASNITTGTLDYVRLPANVVIWSNTNTFTGIQTYNANVFVNTSVLSVGNTTSNVTVNTTNITIGNATVNSTINSTSFSGTANNATNLGGVAAAGYQTTAGLSANVATLTANNATNLGGLSAASYQTTAGLSGNVATLTANNATNLGGVAAANYINTSGAYTITGVHTMNANLFVNAATLSIGNTTANVTANTTVLVVGNGTINVSINSTTFSGTANNATNLGGVAAAGYQTTAGLSANVATLTANNATNLNGQPSTFYTNATNLATGTVPTVRLATGTADSTTFLRGDQTWAVPAGGGFSNGTGYVWSAVQTFNANAFVNTATLSIGTTTSNVTANATTIVVGTTTTNVSINSTAFSGTANNATNLGGVAAAGYQTTAGLSANVATLTANNATNLGGVAAAGYQTTAGLSANVATLTANNATNLGGVAAANYINTSGAYTITGVHTMNANLFVNTATLTVGNSTVNVFSNTTTLTVGNTTVNAVVSSTLIVIGNTTVNNSLTGNTITINAGTTTGNAIINSTALFIGNTQVNTQIVGSVADIRINQPAAVTLTTNSVGYRGVPSNEQTGTTYTFAIGDSGKAVLYTVTTATATTWTVPNNATVAYPIGTMICVDNSLYASAGPSANIIITGNTTGVGIRNTGQPESTLAREFNKIVTRGNMATLRKIANEGTNQSVTAIAFTGSNATANTAASHGLIAGDYIIVSGASESVYNGLQRIIATPASNQFTYFMTGTPTAVASGTLNVKRSDLWNITGSFTPG